MPSHEHRQAIATILNKRFITCSRITHSASPLARCRLCMREFPSDKCGSVRINGTRHAPATRLQRESSVINIGEEPSIVLHTAMG